MVEKKKSDLIQLIVKIEIEVRHLLEENARLRAQVSELSETKTGSHEALGTIAYLDDEIKKLRRTVTELQDQEMTNKNRIFQIRKLIQQEINKRISSQNKDLSDPKIKKENIQDDPISSEPEFTEDETEKEISYKPYISIDEEDVITHQPIVGSDDIKNFIPVATKKNNHSSPTKDSQHAESKDPQPPRDSNKIYVDNKLSEKKNSSSFVVNDFVQEDDPFGEEESKMEDDDFFKNKS